MSFVSPCVLEDLDPTQFTEATKPGKEEARIYDLLTRCTHRLQMELRESFQFQDYDAVNMARVLRALRTREHLRPRNIANQLGLTRPTITKLLRRLEQKGFVETFEDDIDLRSRRVKLTERGWREGDEVDRLTRWLMHWLLEQFSETQKTDFLTLLEKLHTALSYSRVMRYWGAGPPLRPLRRRRAAEDLADD
jgi:MarR family transcriptional regulator, negative regulator of the multidrug operon emrRAB